MPAYAGQMRPFLARLPSLDPAQRAMAVHFGHFPGDGQPVRTAANQQYASAAPAVNASTMPGTKWWMCRRPTLTLRNLRPGIVPCCRRPAAVQGTPTGSAWSSCGSGSKRTKSCPASAWEALCPAPGTVQYRAEGPAAAANRRASASGIELAREIFIRHALVYGEWSTRHDFFHHNRKQLEQAEELEHRARRRDPARRSAPAPVSTCRRTPRWPISGTWAMR